MREDIVPCWTLLALASTLAIGSGALAQDIAIVAEVGDVAPGPANGATFVSLGFPRIGPQGVVVFSADLSDGTTPHEVPDESLWVGTLGALALLAREGQAAPGTEPDTVFESFQDAWYVVTASGEVAFHATLENAVTPLSGGNNLGFWAGTPGNLRLLARAGDSAPGMSGETISAESISGPPVYTDGGLALRGVTSPSVTAGIWSGLAKPLSLVAGVGAPAPHDPTFSISDLSYPVINGLGQLAFFATGSPNPQARILFGPAGALTTFVRSGDSPPPGGLAITLNITSPMGVNDAGQLAFTSNAAELDAVWAGSPSDLRVIARADQEVPDDESGLTFLDILERPILINGRGMTVFEAQLSGPANRSGLFVATLAPGTGLRTLARTDVPLPGQPGTIFRFGDRSINLHGQTAFFAGGALWRGVPGDVGLLAKAGTQFDAGLKGVRTIIDLPPANAGSGNQDGQPSFLSDTGHVVFLAGINPGLSHAVLITPGCSEVPDTDGDVTGDVCDNCPAWPNQQGDLDGNGRGDLCECGDVTRDGGITVSDIVAINECIFAPLPKPQSCIDFCDSNGDGQCNVSDIVAANSEIFSPGQSSTCSRQPVATIPDNCPFWDNPDQADTDGNGRGNACECGDVDLDGRITVSDIVAISECIFAPLPKPQPCIDFCDGNNDGQCNVNDIIGANAEIFSPTNTSTCSRQPVPGP